MRKFSIDKQIRHAEEMKLGRVQTTYSYSNGEFNCGQERMDAAKNPPNTMVYMNPANKKRGVAKPGQ